VGFIKITVDAEEFIMSINKIKKAIEKFGNQYYGGLTTDKLFTMAIENLLTPGLPKHCNCRCVVYPVMESPYIAPDKHCPLVGLRAEL